MKTTSQRGFTLLELVIVLGITGLIFGGLWALLSGGNSQLQAQTVARQYKQVLEAARQYAVGGNYTSGTNAFVTAPTIANLISASLLPANFSSTDAMGNAMTIRIYAVDATRNLFRIVVYSDNSNTATRPNDKMGAQISALIGAEGGFVYSVGTDGCTGGAFPVTSTACGSYNAFRLNLADATVPFVAGDSTGRVVAYGYTGDSNAGIAPYLYRKAGYSPQELYTMQSDMFFNSGLSLNMAASSINMGANSAAVTGGGALRMAQGNLLAQGGKISLGADTTIATGGGTLNMAGGTISNAPTIRSAASITLDPVNDLLVNMREMRVTIDAGSTAGISVSKSGCGTGCTQVLLAVNGYATAENLTAGSFVYSSDSSLKENIRPIFSALGKLLQVKGVQFDWRKDHKGDMGLLAQDVKAVFPEAVRTLPGGTLGVDYARLVAPIIESLRELKTENDRLRAEIDALSHKIEKQP